MVIVSHRGNLKGSCTEENKPEAIIKASNICYCELDLWACNNQLYLGHDKPLYKIAEDFLHRDNLIIHAKNLDAVNFLYNTSYHWFWHEQDMLTITSKGKLWCYPEIYIPSGITVVKHKNFKLGSYGLCTDYPLELISQLSRI